MAVRATVYNDTVSPVDVVVTLRNNGAVAPAGVYIDVSVSGFNLPDKELWVEGDTGHTTAAIPAAFTEMIGVWGSGSLRYFWTLNTCHVYPDDQEYTGAVFVSDGVRGKTVFFTVQLTADGITTANTIYVDPAGTLDVQHAGTPAGAQYAVTLAQAATKINANKGIATKCLFKRTGSWAGTSFGSSLGVADGQVLILDAYGTGALPLLEVTSAGADGVSISPDIGSAPIVRILNLDFKGDWDPLTETGTKGTGVAITRDCFGDFLIHECVLRNWGNAILPVGFTLAVDGGPYPDWHSNTAYPFKSVIVSNTDISDHNNYIILDSNNIWGAIIASRALVHPQSFTGGRGADGNGHAIRYSTPGSIGRQVFRLMHGFSMYNNKTGDWAAAQPVVRWNFGQRKDCKATMDRCLTEGSCGFNVCVGKGQGQRCDVDMQSCLHIHTAQTGGTQALNISASGVTAKSMVFIIPNLRTISDNSILPKSVRLQDGAATDADHANTPVRLLNFTIIDHREGTNQRGTGTNGDAFQNRNLSLFTDLEITNEVYWFSEGAAANNYVVMEPYVPFTTAVLYPAHYESFQYYLQPTPNTAFGIPAGLEQVARPTGATPEVGKPRARRDLLGAALENRGAYAEV